MNSQSESRTELLLGYQRKGSVERSNMSRTEEILGAFFLGLRLRSGDLCCFHCAVKTWENKACRTGSPGFTLASGVLKEGGTSSANLEPRLLLLW